MWKCSGLVALVFSLLVHGLLALALAAYLEHVPRPDALATLDMSRVELSFAEQVDESAEVVQSLPQPSAQTEFTLSKDENPPRVATDKPQTPQFEEIRLPEPKEEARLQVEDEKTALSTQDDAKRQTVQQSDISAVAPRQAQIDVMPQPRRAIRPDYPKGARSRGEQGEVLLEVVVNAAGAAESVVVVSSCGFSELDAAAVRAVRKAVFKPATRGGEAVSSTVKLPLSFRLK